ncbi:two-component sensor histidine kinase [Nocardioides rotundus]|uniref:sensor histidine kinase n=1 Tax=Nocardioides rotundus TaxID=1774216 RepID=UPI001CBC07BF|nr:histidine kinase [Nocardioides rotundus]UAL29835.1 two-component sensor histidine kinase [Nocardioides rotundus]
MSALSRSRAASIAVVGGCAALGVVLAVAARAESPPQGAGSFALDLGVGVLACGLLWWRREQPVVVGLLTALCDLVSFVGTPAYLVAVFAVGARRPPRTVALVALAHLVAVVVGAVVGGSSGEPVWLVAVSAALVLALVASTGLYLGARRELVASLRERADRLEADRERDLATARASERTRIAGEIHDVLAHRISLISLHAGGLQMSGDRVDPHTADTAALIGSTARSAMVDLRDVIGLLRQPDHGSQSERPPPPQPTLGSVWALVDESRQAGLPVDLRIDVEDRHVHLCPAAIGRHAYRVVQESLTNVHKHTSLAPTCVRVSGAPGSRLCVEVSSDLGAEARADGPLPGSGSGLVGLHERVTGAGGVFRSGHEAGPTGRRFVVRAELAWP